MSCEIHLNDAGLQFKITILQCNGTIKDISYATTKQIIFEKPSGTIVTKTATFFTDGTDGIIYYNTVDGDLDEEGIWHLQARIAAINDDKRSDVVHFRVRDILE
jgi:hypothetical protein